MKCELNKLECYVLSTELRQFYSKIVKTYLPSSEQRKLSDQMIRASRSIPANIAEGFGRYSFKDRCHYLYQARGSAYELLEHLSVCLDEEYITRDLFDMTESKTSRVIRVINGYIKFLKNNK